MVNLGFRSRAEKTKNPPLTEQLANSNWQLARKTKTLPLITLMRLI
jgi:hypothetical protein